MNKIKKVLKKSDFINNLYMKAKYFVLRRRIAKRGHLILNDAYKALEDKGLVYFADFGTLLGFVREKDFIAHDPDIDISVVVQDENTQALVEELMLKEGFKKFLTFKKDDLIAEQAFVKHGIKIDVFYYFKVDDENMIAYSFISEEVNYPFLYNKTTQFMFNPTVTETEIFNNGRITFPIPVNYIDLIICKYGKDWQTPVKEWELEDYEDTIAETSLDGIQIRHY